MNEEKKYFIIMIINIMITLILLIYVLFYKYKGCTDKSAKCSSAFNCSTCENGTATCSYINDNNRVETGLKCPCDTEVSK